MATHPGVSITVTGDALPEILTNSEGSFYFRAIQQADEGEWWQIPFLPMLSIVMMGLALLGLVLGWRRMNKG